MGPARFPRIWFEFLLNAPNAVADRRIGFIENNIADLEILDIQAVVSVMETLNDSVGWNRDIARIDFAKPVPRV